MKSLFTAFFLLVLTTSNAQSLSFDQTVLSGLPDILTDITSEWADMDGDGDMDVLIHGMNGAVGENAIYQNNGDNSFTIHTTLPNWTLVDFAWQDYDLDGDEDFIILGQAENLNWEIWLYKNEANQFIGKQTTLPTLNEMKIQWGNIDNDLYPDLAIIGTTNFNIATVNLYSNLGNGGFQPIVQESVGLSGYNSVEYDLLLTDFNNDNFMDFIYRTQSELQFFEQTSLNSFEWKSDLREFLTFNGPLTSSMLDATGTRYFHFFRGNTETDLVIQSPNYSMADEEINQEIELENGEYFWWMRDQIGNGFKSPGYARLTDNTGKVIFEIESEEYFRRQEQTAFCVGQGEHCFVSPLHLEMVLDEDPEQISWMIYSSSPKTISLVNNQAELEFIPTPFEGHTYSWADIDQDGEPDALTQQLNGEWNWILNKSNTWELSDTIISNASFEQVIVLSSNDKVGVLFTVNNTGVTRWILASPSNTQVVLVPQAPQNLELIARDVEIVDISWESTSPFSSYELEVTKDGSILNNPVSAFGKGFIGNNTSSNLRLLESGNYSLRVRAIGMNGQRGAYSSAISFDIELPENFNIFAQVTSNLLDIDGNSQLVDIDGDGDLDVFLDGTECANCFEGDLIREIQILENINGVLVDIKLESLELEGTQRFIPSASSWIDIDLDNDLDLVIGGRDEFGEVRTLLLINDKFEFEDTEINLPAIEQGSFAWGDFDNDGDDDVFVTGSQFGGSLIAKLYLKAGESFIDSNIEFTPLKFETVSWVDFDNDGDLDLSRVGTLEGGKPKTELYENDNDQLNLIDPGFVNVHLGSFDWADIDNDGDKDFILLGNLNDALNQLLENAEGTFNDPNPVAKIYLNNNGEFVEQPNAIVGLINSSISFGDVDNDGDLDMVAIGESYYQEAQSWELPTKEAFHLYINNGSDFELQNLSFQGLFLGNASMGDLDLDGDLDILVNGGYYPPFFVATFPSSAIYLNNKEFINSPPEAPSNVTVSNTSLSSVEIIWDEASDIETVAQALTYDVQLFKNELLISTISPLNKPGDISSLKKKMYTNLTPGNYKAMIYTIDAGLKKSTPAEIEFIIFEPFSRIRSLDIQSFLGNEQWVDINNDGFLDLSVTNLVNNREHSEFSLLINDGNGSFVNENSITIESQNTISDWADFDNDGLQDLMVNEQVNGESEWTNKVFQNSGSSLQLASQWNINSGFFFSPGDYDNDGDLDIIISGSFPNKTSIYRNLGNSFLEQLEVLNEEIYLYVLEWIDYDSDGDLDLLLCGETLESDDFNSNKINLILNNDKGLFSADSSALQVIDEIRYASKSDIDGDGDEDLVLALNFPTKKVKTFINENGIFKEGQIILDKTDLFSQFPMDWGDFDNDGDPDLVMSWTLEGTRTTRIFRNDNGLLIDAGFEAYNVSGGVPKWGDFDSDNDLDLFVSGWDQFEYTSNILENVSERENSRPSTPSNLSSKYQDGYLLLSWSRGYDSETDSITLSYNVKLWNQSETYINPTTLDDGTLTLIQHGNAGRNPFYKFDGSRLPDGEYTWSVQSIDNGYLGSEFTESKNVLLCFNYFSNDLNLSTSSLTTVGSPIRFDFEIPDNTIAFNVDFGDGIAETDTRNHVYSAAGTYTVMLTLVSDLGCEYIETIEIEVLESASQPKITNVITPNGDGKNDFLIVTEARLDLDNTLEVFNSYGESLFKATNYLNDWDGTYNGSILPAGQYLAVFINEGVKTSQVFSILR